MGYIIGNADFTLPEEKSPNSLEIDSDNLQVYSSSLGNTLVTNGNMGDVGGWNNYGSPITNERSADYKHGDAGYSRKIVIDATGNNAGISQSITSLSVGKKYIVTAWVYGFNLGGGSFYLSLGTDVNTMMYSNGAWAKLEGIKTATASSLSILIYISSSPSNASKTFYIDDVSVQEIIEGNLVANGCITGNSLTPNFVPALFGIHWNASSVIEYLGGSTQTLPSTITWTCTGKENVVQTISYDTSDRPIQIQTQGAGSGRTATETLTWSGDNLTNYSISIS